MSLNPHEVTEVAARARRSVGAVRRYLKGENNRPTVRSDIEAALVALGHGRLTRSHGKAAPSRLTVVP